MSWEHAAEARAALNAIVSDPQHGVGALSSAQTMSNLLKDLLPDAPREKSILVAAAEAGLANTLRQHVEQGMDPDTAIRLTASSFSSTTPFTPEACSWVTGEVATALGMSHSNPVAGAAPAAGTAPAVGGFGGTPAGFDPIGQQGMPTRPAPIPGPGYAAGQQPAPGFGPPPPQGGFGAAGQPGAQAPWQPAGQPSSQPGGFGQGQPGGGYGGQPGGGFGGQPGGGQPGGFGQGQPGGGFGGRPGGFGQGQPGGFGGQPGGAGWQPGGGYGPGGQAGPMGPLIPGGPGGPGGPVKPGGRGRAIAIAGGLIGGLVVVGIIVASLSGGNKPHQPAASSPPPTSAPASSTPATSPTTIHPSGTEALTTIMNPADAGAKPLGTDCSTAKLFGLKASTLDARTFCLHTTHAHIKVWGYQFDSLADYQAGLAHINHYVGFDQHTPVTSCPPSSGSAEGKVGWHAIHNPKYFSRSGQDLECLVDGGNPVVIWTMPTQDVFFIGQNGVKGTSISTVISWWKTLTYG